MHTGGNMNWIKLEDRVPKTSVDVLVRTKNGWYDVCHIRIEDKETWFENDL